MAFSRRAATLVSQRESTMTRMPPRSHFVRGMLYARFSGVTFITMMGVLFAPALHRFLHRFHLEIYSQEDEAKSP